MAGSAVVHVTPETFYKLDNIAHMCNLSLIQKWRRDLESGTRFTYAYTINNTFVGEVSLVLEHNDPLYTIPHQRAYLHRLIVHDGYRNRGVAKALIDFLFEEAQSMGFSEISVGVDKDNTVALHIYHSKGFDTVLFDGEDEYGPCYKLLKKFS